MKGQDCIYIFTPPRFNEDSTAILKYQSKISLKDKFNTADIQLGRESKPLDGSASHLEGGPLTAQIELAESDCCYYSNYEHPSKIVTEEGLWSKLHICLHENCRTLFHHGHRRRDHKNGSL